MFEKVVSYLAVDGTIHKTENEAGLASIVSILEYDKYDSIELLTRELKILAKNQDVMDWLTDYIKK